MKNGKKRICCLLAALTLCAAAGSCRAEEAQAEEAGVLELQPLMNAAEVEDTEGMDLEQLTEAYMNGAMSEYFNSATGLSLQYPALFSFDEEAGNTGVSADGKARIVIESIEADGNLKIEQIRDAILLESPETKQKEYPGEHCVRFDRTVAGGLYLSDLYLLTEHWLHHISVAFPEEEKETYEPYLDYIARSITTDETDIG